MIKRILAILIITIIGVSSILPSVISDSRGPDPLSLHAEAGTMELSAWDIQKDPTLKLDGEWEFYWNQLLGPEDFQPDGGRIPQLTGYMRVPSIWSGKELNGTVLPAFGCATYRLVLKNIPYHGVLGLKKENVRLSSRVYVDGQELFSDGVPSLTEAEYESGNNPQLGFYYCDGSELEIIVQAANYDYINGGIPVSFKIGEQTAMLSQQEKGNLLGFSVLVTLWSIALLYLIFFINARFFKRKAASLLSFAIFCFLFAVGNALTDQRPLVMMLPDISFEAIFKMKDFFLSASLIAVTVIFYQARKGIISLRMTGIVSAVYGCYLIAVLILPIYIYYKLHPFIMLLNTIVLIILLARTTVLFLRCKKSDVLDYLLLFIAILALNLYSVDSILFALSLKTVSSLCQIYIVTFALVTIFRLSMHYYEVLANLRISMKRTQDAEIAFLRSQIKPHFLYNALNSIAALCKEAPDQAEDVVIQLSEYLRGSFDFKTLDSLTTVKKETELLEAYLNIEKVRFGKRLNVEYDIDESINFPIPPLILQPLVENAVRHGLMSGVSGGTVKISIKKEMANVVFSIEDDGIGMEPSQVKRLLEQAPDENGVGLWNINQRLRLIYGNELEVWSERGAGTRVSFQLPWNSQETSLSRGNL
ncbi:hypothetical protein SDC9_09217 [bioreactor metagenome]|uniref:Histidine kinase domain-containing protein n=1 Tax=bioreactor metagenome TaxID=1076179 RepID=A0A644T9F5_9ZZZZ|nr:histidine kinase [Desulfitobacterium hafniense]MEA5024112.1 histidine kinase [Desulfitobacterium hafniense]